MAWEVDPAEVRPLLPGSDWINVGRYFAPKNAEDVFSGIISRIRAVKHRVTVTADARNSSYIYPGWSSLSENGCNTRHGTRNCTLACTDTQSMFESLDTITNCIAVSAATLSLNWTSPTSFMDDELNTLTSFGVSNLGNFDAFHVLSTLAECANASCQDTGYKRCSPGIQTLSGDIAAASPAWSALELILQEMGSYCNNTLLPFVSVADDVVGPGVLISHLVQIVLVITFFLLIQLFNTWPQCLAFLVKYTNPKNSAGNPFSRFQSRLYRSFSNSAILATAVELQEAQAYLTIAIQIATIITLRPLCDPDCTIFNSIASISEGMMSASLLRSVAVTSILPVLLLQCSLQLSQMRWLYPLLLTIAVCIPAAVVHSQSSLPPLSVMQAGLKHTEPVPQCGNHMSLMAYCLEAMPYVKIPVILGVLPLAFTTVGILVVDQMLHTLSLGPALSRFQPLAKGVVHVLLVMLEAGLLAGIALHLGNILGLLNNKSVVAGEFTYGQYLASMVWVPVVGKFVYYNLFGVVGGFQGRLSRRYLVVEREREMGIGVS
ncbi:hypothetical protein QBC34DRAFT_166059 [Podospora aff. communis PSN243]|uniref:Uncharacterized protein n=1 Tax=Podospora aff. communis PSN243 TaxID=3040156 RepID=A0AAV9GAI8_9PEZI|nr:hypothetical protein QBC34DRAFT_166059 [Podospora aff. communis PSN243]